MGATDETYEVPGHPLTEQGMQDAFREAYEQAVYEFGHDPYSGSIATAQRPVRMQGLPKGDLTAEDALDRRQIADLCRTQCPEDLHPKAGKWGAAVGIPAKYEYDSHEQLGWTFYFVAAT